MTIHDFDKTDLVEEREYLFEIINFKMDVAQSSGNEYVWWQAKILDAGYERVLSWYSSLTDKALWTLRVLLKAIDMPHSGKIDISPAFLQPAIHRRFRAKAVTVERKGRKRSEPDPETMVSATGKMAEDDFESAPL